MELRARITEDMKAAMKAGDRKKLGTLRLMQAAIKDKDINSRTEGHESALTPDSAIIDLFAKMVKQRQETATVYTQGGRPGLARNEMDEVAIIQAYLPRQMGEDEVKAAVAGVIAAIGAAGMKDMGKVMAELKAQYSGQMDMAKVGGIVKGLLG
ncbi:MAG TPA: GatB/YqeY domain-containing protein [Aestuariivirga sp.]|nr:GatB/YqeY domain-containing protein [Aestuariivirga sp.]